MDMPIFSKDIIIENRTFRVKKFNAMTGCYTVFKIAGLLVNSFKNMDKNFKMEDLNLNYTQLFSSIFSLSKEDFEYIQKSCLQVSYEVLPAGETQVLGDNGEFETSKKDEDKCNTALIMNLTIQSLLFNLESFFEGSSLSSLLGNVNL